uniref:Uncharacterized protein n=1 Tax=Arundo donax TaxID=35708 RepID=A0A0A9GE57_ARUDO
MGFWHLQSHSPSPSSDWGTGFSSPTLGLGLRDPPSLGGTGRGDGWALLLLLLRSVSSSMMAVLLNTCNLPLPLLS